MRNFIEKQRNILDFTLSSLLRRKGKNFALIVVYTLVVFGLGSVMFFTQALEKGSLPSSSRKPRRSSSRGWSPADMI